MVGRAGGYALLGSVPLVLTWLLMCRLAPRLLIVMTNLVVIASSVVTLTLTLTRNPNPNPNPKLTLTLTLTLALTRTLTLTLTLTLAGEGAPADHPRGGPGGVAQERHL